MVDSIEVGVVVQDTTTRMSFANPWARRLLGLQPGAPLDGRSSHDASWDAIYPDGTPCPGAAHPASIALRERRIVRGVVLGVRHTAEDRRVWLQVTSCPRLSADGEVLDVVTTFTDVTPTVDARAASAEALRLSDANYRTVLGAMAEALVVLGPRGQLLTCNQAAEQMLGLTVTPQNALAPPVVSYRTLDEQGLEFPLSEHPIAVTLRTGGPTRNRLVQLVHRDGRRLWVRINADAIRFEPGATRGGVVATFVEVTREQLALEALTEQRARLQLVTEAVPGVVFEYLQRPDGTDAFNYIGPGVQELLGVTAEEVLRDAQAFMSRVHPEDLARAKARAGLLEAGSVLDEELRVGPPGKPQHAARMRLSAPRQTPEGRVMYGLLLDVTDQRRLTERLRDAQRQEGLGLLAAGVAHNFNNILSAIVPNLQRLRADAPDHLKGDLDDAWQAAQSASELVRQLSQLVRRDASPELSLVDCGALLADVLGLCRRTFDQRIVVTSSAPGERVVVRARRSELQQMLLNLCVNARDAMEHARAPSLHVALTRDGAQACLTVTDTGSGMTEHTLRRLGEPFFTTREPGRGTGLGVATALGIVRELGGEMTWTSTLGAGSCFTVRLPAPVELPNPAPSTPRPVARPLAGKRVLIIDDEPLVRRSLRRLLDRAGLEVLDAPDGPTGLAVLASRHDVDAVFVDLSMPEMTGDEVLRRIRAQWPTLPVFILSGFVPDPGALGAATGIISKPFTHEVVHDALLSALQPA